MSRIFALIPAAGNSTRMGVSKLTLPVPGGTVIERLVRTLRSKVDETVVLLKQKDRDLSRILRDMKWVRAIETEYEPPDMRSTVSLLLSAIEAFRRPGPQDAWVLTPGDCPFIRPKVLKLLIDAFITRPDAIHIPTFEGQGGHPAVFPWRLTELIRKIPPGQGINALRTMPNVATVLHPVDDASILWDLDTPEDYRRLLATLESGNE